MDKYMPDPMLGAQPLHYRQALADAQHSPQENKENSLYHAFCRWVNDMEAQRTKEIA